MYVLEASSLGKRYGKDWALQNCNLQVPMGSVAGLIGLNGAGKTTLMHLAVGLIESSEGSMSVLELSPDKQLADLLPRIGFVPQERVFYKGFSVRDMLMLGKKLNPRWDEALAQQLASRLYLPLRQKTEKLSGGQRDMLAVIMALAKNAELLLLDEPFASLDPLARRECLKMIMETVEAKGTTVLLSSHIVSDLEQACGYMVILSSACVQLAGDRDSIMESHKLLIGPSDEFEPLSKEHTVVQAHRAERQTNAVVRLHDKFTEPNWQVKDMTLEDIALAYLSLRPEETPEMIHKKAEVL
ncbi:MAG TPA: ABC transporter ATP-binding protein [Ktedonobacteraceae bacterium]|jgi:ABC-2 type transport system ATP-binding protein